jgi:hypothetical protein
MDNFFLIAPFVFGIQRCCWKLSFGTLMVMKISLNGQFFLVVPLTLEFKDVYFCKPSLGTPMVMKISLKR